MTGFILAIGLVFTNFLGLYSTANEALAATCTDLTLSVSPSTVARGESVTVTVVETFDTVAPSTVYDVTLSHPSDLIGDSSQTSIVDNGNIRTITNVLTVDPNTIKGSMQVSALSSSGSIMKHATITISDAVQYAINISTDGNGTASAASATSSQGSRVNLSATPNTGYRFSYWEVLSGGAVVVGRTDPQAYFIMNDSSDVAIKAHFAVNPEYSITVDNDGNGVGVATPVSATAGTSIALSATPNTGYQFKEWQVLAGGVSVSGNSFIMPANAVTVKAVFEAASSTPPTTEGEETNDSEGKPSNENTETNKTDEKTNTDSTNEKDEVESPVEVIHNADSNIIESDVGDTSVTVYNISLAITPRVFSTVVNTLDAKTSNDKSLCLYSIWPLSMNKTMLQSLSNCKSPVEYYFYYRGHLYCVTIPPNTDVSSIFKNNYSYAGPLYIGQQLGTSRLIK